ncbi:WD40 repeat domain-containing protein [Marinicella meishanensis]|uniref:WD40 repeat domain-containing protein n=1 Tax=Marinicella meishanensis TaxID=2873263 RepID=UPI001CBF3E89|nr:WD40 repeat domain-containing protein [Marinicella sp. NBU2979]
MTFQSPTPTWTIPPAQVNSVAISDDGTRCVYGSSFERGQGYFYTYMVDNQGNQLWKQPIQRNTATYQGVYWVDISGDAAIVAAGGETVDYHEDPSCANPGFLQAFVGTTGEKFLDITKPARINQVSLSHDGSYLAICYGQTVEVYKLKKLIITPGLTNYQFDSIFTHTSTTYDINSCVISHDGSTVVAAAINWDANKSGSTDTHKGAILSFSINDTTVSTLGTCDLTTAGPIQVAVTDNGSHWAASLHDGSCALVNNSNPSTLVWQHLATPATGYTLDLAYAVAIGINTSGNALVACGANLSGGTKGGLLYLVENVSGTATAQWQAELSYGANPGVSMDHGTTHVTATDGKPVGQTTTESAGNLYLFKVADGSTVIQQPTFMMNWPMQISRDGSAVVGASDDGTVYYWKSPYTSAG